MNPPIEHQALSDANLFLATLAQFGPACGTTREAQNVLNASLLAMKLVGQDEQAKKIARVVDRKADNVTADRDRALCLRGKRAASDLWSNVLLRERLSA